MSISIPTPETSRQSWRNALLAAVASAVLGTVSAHAEGGCPPGYRPDPNYNPNSPVAHTHPQRCVPAPLPTAKFAGTPNPAFDHARKPPVSKPHYEVAPHVGPIGPGPIESSGGVSSGAHAFRPTGTAAINSQPNPSAKVALNPQPIPPGRTLRRVPQPGAPIEKTIGH